MVIFPRFLGVRIYVLKFKVYFVSLRPEYTLLVYLIEKTN